jgi:hypothetical protein
MPNWKKVIVSGSDASLNTLNVSTSLTASGLIYPATDNGEESFIQTNGSGILSLQYVKTIYEEIYNGEATSILKGTPVYVSGSIGAASIVYIADAGNPTKMPVVYVSADTIASGETGRGIALGLIKGVDTTGYPAGTEIFVGVGGGWTSTRPTGSAIIQVLGYVTKEGNGGQGVILNPGPASLPNLNSGSIWVGNSSSIPVAIPTSSIQNVISSSYATTASYIDGATTGISYTLAQTTPSTTWTLDHNLNNSYPVITVYDNSGFVLIPSSIQSTSVNQTVITFSYSASGYATAVVEGVLNTSSSYAQNATTASFAVTASYALNGGGGGLATKAGSIANSSFAGTPLSSSITFASSFLDDNYAITVTGEDARTWTIQAKSSSSFAVNSNSSVALTGTTYWIATAYGETS